MWNCLSSDTDGVEHARGSASLTSSRAPQPANDPSCQSCRLADFDKLSYSLIHTHTHSHTRTQRTLGFHDQTNWIDSSADLWKISYKFLLPPFAMQHTAKTMDREIFKSRRFSRRPTGVLHFLSLLDTWSFVPLHETTEKVATDSACMCCGCTSPRDTFDLICICHTQQKKKRIKERNPVGCFSSAESIRSSLVLQDWRRSLRLPIQAASLLSQWKEKSSSPQPQTITRFCVSVTRIYCIQK